MSKDKPVRLSDNELQKMFEEKALIVRPFEMTLRRTPHPAETHLTKPVPFRDAIDSEVKLNTQGENGTIEPVIKLARLLLPGTKSLFNDDIGFLYDKSKSKIVKTIENVPEIPYKTEADFYKVPVPRNQVEASFTAQALVGLVAPTETPGTLLMLLAAKQHMAEKYDIDLPMSLMRDGKLESWNPNLSEIGSLIYHSTQDVNQYSYNADLAKSLGFFIPPKHKVDQRDSTILIYAPEKIIVLNKNESTVKEVAEFLHIVTGIPKGGPFTYGIAGRLEEVVNQRLKDEGLIKIGDGSFARVGEKESITKSLNTVLDNVIITKKDIENLVTMLDKEMVIKDPNHKVMDEKEISILTNSIMKEIDKKRPGKKPQLSLELSPKMLEIKMQEIKKTLSPSKIREFFNKVAGLFKENLVTRRIKDQEKFKDPQNSRTR